MNDNTFQELYGQVDLEQGSEEYEEGEMQMISRKIFSFFNRVDEKSQKDAAKKIGVCIYLYAEQEGTLTTKIPYQGKADNFVRDITFDLKNIPPMLARCIARVIEETEFTTE